MKTLIAVPCMQTVPTKFLRCLEALERIPGTYTGIIESTLIDDARNEFASIAITKGFDRVMWFDSDMVFEPDIMRRMSEVMDASKGRIRMLSGLYFKRVMPTEPVLYCRMEKDVDKVIGEYIKPVVYRDYPRDQLFEVDACGFGVVMTDVALLQAAWDQYGPPFLKYINIGEDMSFCWRVREMGVSIWCDSRIKAGHIGHYVYGEETWDGLQGADPR